MKRTLLAAALMTVTTSALSSPNQSYLSRWDRICSDSSQRDRHVECWRPPGDYQAVYQMTGDKRRRAEQQGRRALEIRRNTDNYMRRR